MPPFGVIAAALAFGDRLTISHFIGVAIVLGGLALMLHGHGRSGEAAPAPRESD